LNSFSGRTERYILLKEAEAAGMRVDVDQGSIELGNLSAFDTLFTELAGRTMVFNLPDAPWFKFYSVYLRYKKDDWEEPIYFYWYIPLPYSKEDMKVWVSEVLEHTGLKFAIEVEE
jgi:hypothetical protein